MEIGIIVDIPTLIVKTKLNQNKPDYNYANVNAMFSTFFCYSHHVCVYVCVNIMCIPRLQIAI